MVPEEPTPEERRAEFAERAEDEAARADEAEEPAERRAHARRAEKAAYLEDKLAEQAEADRG
ncbi:MAG: hypothetical protein E6G10_20675 [Actinobacteria bacterium]|nr:MAG: hypothetical protein E6G10_20675 [Actinomycetota bacterium]